MLRAALLASLVVVTAALSACAGRSGAGPDHASARGRRVAVPVLPEVVSHEDGGRDENGVYVSRAGEPRSRFCTWTCDHVRRQGETLHHCRALDLDADLKNELGSREPTAVLCVFE